MPTTVDKIRRALEKRDGIAEEEMRPLADAYRTEVQDVNQRLDESVMLLRKGLRSEAIQRVEMTPNALDKAAELEFPEWDEWNEILQFMAIPLPPKLNQDYVAQINEAIIESLPLDALLGRHRRLAIAKAPLGVRLRTLRQIGRVDATNPVWSEDIEEWEKLRLQQIESEMRAATDKSDTRQLFMLHRELTGAPWIAKPSPRLIEQSAFAAEAHVRESQESAFSEIAPKLIDAFNRRDEPVCRALRTEWQTARAKFNLDVPEKFQSQVAPAMQWLEDLDRQSVMESERKIAVADLQKKIDSNQSYEEVEAAYQQAQRFGEPVPEELEERVQALAQAPAKQKKRKMQLAIAGAVIGILALGGGAAAMLSSANTAKERKSTIDQMQRFVAAGDNSAAIEFYNQISQKDPSLAQDQQMMGLHVRAKSAIDSENQRKTTFESLYEQANNEDASLIDETLLPQLQEKALTEEEKARVAKLLSRKEQYAAGEATRQSDEMLEKVGDLRTEFARIRSRGTGDDTQRAVQSLLNSVTRLPSQFPMHNDDALAAQETLQDQVRSTLKQMQNDNMITEMRNDAITELMSSRSLAAFSDQLRSYSTMTVAQTKFVEFETVLDEEMHWLNVDRVNGWLRDNLGGALKDGISSSEAVNLINSVESLNQTVSPNPVLAAIPDFLDTMKVVRDRSRLLSDGFAQIQRHPMASAMTIPESTSNSPTGILNHLVKARTYEANKTTYARSGSIGVPVISNELGAEKNRSFSGPVPAAKTEPMASFQWLVSEKNRSAAQYNSNWERTFIGQIMKLRSRSDLDGLAKEWLINELLTIATRGSQSLKDATLLTRQIMDRRSDARSNWFAPRPSQTSLDAELDKTLFNDMKTAFERFQAPMGDYQKAAGNQLEWIGFLAKSMTGEIEYHVRGRMPDGDGRIFVAVPARDANAKTGIVSVGKLTSGHITLDDNPVYKVPGRPIFLLKN